MRSRAPASRLRRAAVRAAQAIAGLALGLAITEGAFHLRDLSPAGHRALGEAIAKTIAAPPSLPRPHGMPIGRSPLPAPIEWEIRETQVRGSDAASCTTKKVREWFSIVCHTRRHADPRQSPRGVRVVAGGEGDAITLADGGEMTLIAPVIEGEELIADFFWGDHTRRLTITWKKGDVVAEAGFGDELPAAAPPPGPLDLSGLCDCWEEQHRLASCVSPFGEGCLDMNKASGKTAWSSCAGFSGDASEACAKTYAGACASMMACAYGDPSRPPACPDGSVNAGALGRCRTLCAGDADCGGNGACTAYQGAHLCL